MRKKSLDGGDSTSITSGTTENDIKKSGVALIKTKRSSIKKKIQNFSQESDDGVIEPLLQKDKEKIETINQSAKYLPAKCKTEPKNKNEKNQTIKENKALKLQSPIEVIDNSVEKFSTNKTAPGPKQIATVNQDNFKNDVLVQSPLLVEISGNKKDCYNPNPLIFTTAKIHTDAKNTHLDPVQVTSVPILSTLEGNVLTNDNKVVIEMKKNVPSTSSKGDTKTTGNLKTSNNSTSIACTKTGTDSKNGISSNEFMLSTQSVSTVTTGDEIITPQNKAIKTENDDKNFQDTAKNISSFTNSIVGITTQSQSNVSYCSSDISTLKKSPITTSKQANNVSTDLLKSSKFTETNQANLKADNNKSINKAVSKIQESQVDVHKIGKNESSIDVEKEGKLLDNAIGLSELKAEDIDTEKVRKHTSEKELLCQKKSLKTDTNDLNRKSPNGNVPFSNNGINVSKSSGQEFPSNNITQSKSKNKHIVKESDKSNIPKRDKNLDEISTTANKLNKTPVTISSDGKSLGSTTVTKAKSNSSCVSVCTTTFTLSSSIPSTSKSNSFNFVKPETATKLPKLPIKNLDGPGSAKTNISVLNTKSTTVSTVPSNNISVVSYKAHESNMPGVSMEKNTLVSTLKSTTSVPKCVKADSKPLKSSANTSTSTIKVGDNMPTVYSNSTPSVKTIDTVSPVVTISSGPSITTATTVVLRSENNGKESTDKCTEKGLKAHKRL